MHAIGKRRLVRSLALITMAGALLVGGQAAVAQTSTTDPYPGGTSTTQPARTSSTVNLGARGLGSRFTVSVCGFRVGSPVGMATNNVSVPGDTADSNTCAQVTFFIRPTLFPAGQTLRAQQVGSMLAVTGLAQTSRGTVVVEVNGKAVNVGPLGSVVTTVAEGTGVNGAPRSVAVSFTVLRASQVDGQGGLARTGAAILKWSPLGAGMLAVGYMLVLVSRRRRAAATA